MRKQSLAAASGALHSKPMFDELDPPSEGLRRRLEQTGTEFLIDFLEVATRLHPENVEAISELGHTYTRQGRYEEGLVQDRRLVRLVPQNPTVHYNLACSLSLTGRIEPAIEALESACELGFGDADHLERDQDLLNLRQDPRFLDLVERLRRGAGRGTPR